MLVILVMRGVVCVENVGFAVCGRWCRDAGPKAMSFGGLEGSRAAAAVLIELSSAEIR